MKKPHPNQLFAFNAQWSARTFKEHGALTAEQFIELAREYLFGEGCEGLYENISQCQSEINMFGDSGPGSMLRLGEQVADFNRIADRYTALTGEAVQRPSMPCYPASNDDYHESEHYYG